MTALALALGMGGVASASPHSETSAPVNVKELIYEGSLYEVYSQDTLLQIDAQSAEELFTKYIDLDARNFMHLNKEAVLNSPYRDNLDELLYFTGVMNEINAQNLGIKSRDAWSFAKCVLINVVGIDIANRLYHSLAAAIRASKWPLTAKTILQIAGSAGLRLGWKANVIGLAISLGKSAITCRSEW